MVAKKWVEVNAFVIMNNHIHLIWQIQEGYERDAVQRNFLKYVSQTIQRDLQKNHPKVLERFYVGAKDRKYQFWERNPLSVDLWTKDVFILQRSPLGKRWNIFITTCLPAGRSCSSGFMHISGRL